MPPVALVDLVSDSRDEEKSDIVVCDSEVLTITNGATKRKIEELKKEPNRKNPWFRNTTSCDEDFQSKTTLAQRVSPDLEQQMTDEEYEALFGEKPVNFVAKFPLKDTTTTAVKEPASSLSTTKSQATLDCVSDEALARMLQDELFSEELPRIPDFAHLAGQESRPSDQQPQRQQAQSSNAVLSLPPRIWWDSSDNAIITHEVLTWLRACCKGGNVLISNATSVPHIQQMDQWSCGFRNIQMLLSGLVPLLPATHPYFQSLMHIYCQEVPDHLLGGSSPVLILPSLTQLQMQLEACWRDGFDQKGADHFEHSVVGKVGRRSQIGAVEVGFVFSYWWLDACVVQFIKCFESRRLLPPFVYHYFKNCPGNQQAKKKATDCLELADKGLSFNDKDSSKQTAVGNTVLPMYLQWEGHSVTVIGIEPPVGVDIRKANWSQWNLLIFCPNRNFSRLKFSNTTVAPFRLSCGKLLFKDCQLVLSGSEPLTSEQRMERKDVALKFVITAADEAVQDCNAGL